MCNFYCALALFLASMGAQGFPPSDPGNDVTWGLASIEYLDPDTGLMVYDAQQFPSETTGCHNARFTGNFLTDTLLQVDCESGGSLQVQQTCE